MNTNFEPLFSAGLQEMMALIFVMVWVIGWVIKTVQGTNQQLPPPVQRPGKRREDRTAEEIDAFLQQVNRAPEKNEKNRTTETGRAGNHRSRSGDNKPVANQRAANRTIQREALPASQAATRRANEAARRSESTEINPNESVAQHVRNHMSERVAEEARRDVGQDIKQSVEQHLGAGFASSSKTGLQGGKSNSRLTPSDKQAAATCCTPGRTESIRQMLSNPESIRQAIVVQEILNRPKCLRKS